MSDNRSRIETAFTALERQGIIARADFMCCGGCAAAAIESRELKAWKGKTPPIGGVHFNQQSTDGVNEYGGSLWISHGSFEDTDEANRAVTDAAVAALRQVGFIVTWDGSHSMCIEVATTDGVWDLDYPRQNDDEEDDAWWGEDDEDDE